MTTEALQAIKITDGIYQLKMPLPFRLNHINLYLLEDHDGWYLVDTGLNTEMSRQLWDDFLHSGFFSKPIKNIVLTHLHPDHIGMSAWLSEQLNASVMISAGDWALAKFLWHNDNEFAQSLYERHWGYFGLSGDALQDMVNLRNHYRKLVKQLPEQVQLLVPGNSLTTLSGQWNFIAGSGHSPEHMCLWNPELQWMISGDHILPTITPNISLLPSGLENPLESYLQSLDDFSQLNCLQYLPAHGPISNNYHERINDIVLHHQMKFAELMNKIPATPISVVDALPMIFNLDLPPHQLMFAYSETAAHLVYLAERGLLNRSLQDNQWAFSNPYRSTAKAPVTSAKATPNPC